jgi:hypothetical protein
MKPIQSVLATSSGRFLPDARANGSLISQENASLPAEANTFFLKGSHNNWRPTSHLKSWNLSSIYFCFGKRMQARKPTTALLESAQQFS